MATQKDHKDPRGRNNQSHKAQGAEMPPGEPKGPQNNKKTQSHQEGRDETDEGGTSRKRLEHSAPIIIGSAELG